MIGVAVSGALGRTGHLVLKGILDQRDMKLVGAIERPRHPMEGVDVGEVLGIGKVGVNVSGSDKLDDLLDRVKPYVIVDFSTPKATVEVVEKGAEYGVNFVIGTTGHSPEQITEIENAVRSRGVSAVMSANMTIMGNLLFKLAGFVAKALGEDYDIEIIEWTDRHLGKIPLPTHTALTIGESIAKALGKDMDKIAIFGREKDLHKALEERPRGQICFHSVRAGSGAFFGEFQVVFAGPWEKMIIINRFDSMEAIVGGTMKAIRFIHERSKHGEIYDMMDVLGLR